MAKSEIIKFRDGGDGLAERFADAVDRSPDPEADMSKILRQFARWYAGDPGVKRPERPHPLEP